MFNFKNLIYRSYCSIFSREWNSLLRFRFSVLKGWEGCNDCQIPADSKISQLLDMSCSFRPKFQTKNFHEIIKDFIKYGAKKKVLKYFPAKICWIMIFFKKKESVYLLIKKFPSGIYWRIFFYVNFSKSSDWRDSDYFFYVRILNHFFTKIIR